LCVLLLFIEIERTTSGAVCLVFLRLEDVKEERERVEWYSFKEEEKKRKRIRRRIRKDGSNKKDVEQV
jgi:hypothetical protein